MALSLEARFWSQPKIELKVRLKPMGFGVYYRLIP